MNEIERRQLLADFLRTRRERLSPADVDLPVSKRRRTPGLRREEVALLANIGVSWYTSLEQGRDVHPSEPVLESLAQALRLTADERNHLFLLAVQHNPPHEPPDKELVNPSLEQVVHSLNPNPAYILGRRWDLLAWNEAAERVFSFSTPLPPHSRNYVWRIFTSQAIRSRQHDSGYVAQGVIARFRADCARYPGDPWFAELITDLQAASESFRELWIRHDVLRVLDCHKEMEHPELGYLEFEHVELRLPDNPDLKVMIYNADQATSAKLSEVAQKADQLPII